MNGCFFHMQSEYVNDLVVGDVHMVYDRPKPWGKTSASVKTLSVMCTDRVTGVKLRCRLDWSTAPTQAQKYCARGSHGVLHLFRRLSDGALIACNSGIWRDGPTVVAEVKSMKVTIYSTAVDVHLIGCRNGTHLLVDKIVIYALHE